MLLAPALRRRSRGGSRRTFRFLGARRGCRSLIRARRARRRARRGVALAAETGRAVAGSILARRATGGIGVTLDAHIALRRRAGGAIERSLTRWPIERPVAGRSGRSLIAIAPLPRSRGGRTEIAPAIAPTTLPIAEVAPLAVAEAAAPLVPVAKTAAARATEAAAPATPEISS
ncbi:MAG: hypothetical protein AVDCRST_MAG18-1967 [uncultured Thermomicrobiales bacterium]|uniref:Uncharacterized protein n=1 Tax=uncultured Thermomicrobiales bacterium TaxID=1645740 RepID=A0A6J4V9E7_9BACT|nr:MAG: hypothetical protein AVDCRST_MAG18-1967 [uncultured Thermomicrobiales bacterium]